MSQSINDSTVHKGLTASYGSTLTSLGSVVSNPSLCMYCDKQSEGVTKCVSLLADNDVDNDMILLNNEWFSKEYRKLVSEEVVAVRRMAKLNRLEQIAAENRVYVAKMRKRFVHSNIVGVDNTLNELNSLTSNDSSIDSDRYDYSDDDYSEYEESDVSEKVSEEYSGEYSEGYSNEYSEESSYDHSSTYSEDQLNRVEEYSSTSGDYSMNSYDYSPYSEEYSNSDDYSTASYSSVYSEENWKKEDRIIEASHSVELVDSSNESEEEWN